ncbi:MAG: hypothetical protein ACUZ8H_05320 [Candidatus Anammoxibacter sp.]
MGDMPFKVVCYYPPGRISSMAVCDELFEKNWIQDEYISETQLLEKIDGMSDKYTIGAEYQILKAVRELIEEKT